MRYNYMYIRRENGRPVYRFADPEAEQRKAQLRQIRNCAVLASVTLAVWASVMIGLALCGPQ